MNRQLGVLSALFLLIGLNAFHHSGNEADRVAQVVLFVAGLLSGITLTAAFRKRSR